MDNEANKESIRSNVEIEVLKSTIKSLHQKKVDYYFAYNIAKEFNTKDQEVLAVMSQEITKFIDALLNYAGITQETLNSL